MWGLYNIFFLKLCLRKQGVPLSMRAFPLALLSWWCISLAFCWKSELPWPSALHPLCISSNNTLHHGLTAFIKWILGQSRKKIFFCFLMNQLKVQMLIPIRNYLNLIFPAACVSVEKNPQSSGATHVANICDAAVSFNLSINVSEPTDTMGLKGF